MGLRLRTELVAVGAAVLLGAAFTGLTLGRSVMGTTATGEALWQHSLPQLIADDRRLVQLSHGLGVPASLLRQEERDRHLALQHSQVLMGSFQRSLRWLLAGWAGTLLALLLLHISLSRQTLGPISSLIGGFRRLARGEYNHRLSLVGPAEFVEVTRAFNAMAEALAEGNKRVTLAAEEERRRLAAELHDETSQLVNALIIAVDSLAVELGPGTDLMRRDLGKARHLAGSLLDSLHSVSRQLRPPLLDELGLGAALRFQVREFEHYYGVEAEYQNRLSHQLSPEAEIGLYRLVQEALTNVGRHAQATSARVELREEGTALLLEVRDNGLGFATDTPDSGNSGLGLRNMRERAALWQGDLRVESVPGQGTLVELRLPLESMLAAESTRAATP